MRARRAGVGEGMTDKPMMFPGPEHPITVELAGSRVVVRVDGKTVADSRRALAMREADYPVVYYIPRQDADLSLLERTDHQTYCPYKGDASYFNIIPVGARGANAVWSYQAPYDAVREIEDHLAFYPDRVDAIEELPE
jgi:uncharacterized protein (DUF427 family)